jgi:hypothetical protein
MTGIRALSAAFGVVAMTVPTVLGPLTATLAASPGAACIAIALPEVRGVPGNAVDAATGVRDLLASYLSGPKAKVVTHKSAGKGLTKAFGQAAGAMSWRVPGGGTVKTAAAGVAAAAGLQTASSLAASTKTTDHLSLEYRLQSAAGKIQFGPRTEEQTATVDGEDLLTPVVSRAAEAIITRNATSRF